MHLKSDKHFLFETNLAWIKEKKGVLSARDADGMLYIETPPAFGGQGKPWTPEHLFLGAISTCFMSTFLAFADKMRFSILAMKAPAIGQVHLVNGHYQFTQVDLYPEVFIEEANREQATKALEKSYKHCLVTQSLGIPVYYHSQVKSGPADIQSEKWLSLPLEGKSQHIIL
jgi:organic hydroperoxide reductase OsmC/OhrA